MQSSGAVYAKVGAGGVEQLERAIVAARAARPARGPLGVLAFTPGEHAFALVDRWGKSDDMPHWSEGPDPAQATELTALSRDAGEVVGFYEVDEGTEFAVYAHWRDGALARALVWGDGEWMRAEGEPQAWEAPLFGAEGLEQALADAREDGHDEADVRAAYAKGRIEAGARWPRPGFAPHLTRAVLGALRAPAWGVQPWPRRRDVVAALPKG